MSSPLAGQVMTTLRAPASMCLKRKLSGLEDAGGFHDDVDPELAPKGRLEGSRSESTFTA